MNRPYLRRVAANLEPLASHWNRQARDHPIHVHGTQFQVVSQTVAGRTVPASYRAWLDTVNVRAGESVTIKTRQTMPGKRMVHCHIIQHEDAGMMAVPHVRQG